MARLAAIEEVLLPDSNDEQMRVGALWEDQPAVISWLRHYG